MTGDRHVPAGRGTGGGTTTSWMNGVLPPGGAPWLAVLGVLLTAVLAGCAGVPQEGPAPPAGPLGARAPQVLFGARPQRGESPEAVVRGFLQAGADFGKDHQVAREYLVPDSEWRPEAPVLVVADDSISVQEEATSGAPVTAPSPASSPTPRPGRPAPSPRGRAAPRPRPAAPAGWRTARPPGCASRRPSSPGSTPVASTPRSRATARRRPSPSGWSRATASGASATRRPG